MIHLVNNPTPLLPWHVDDRSEYDELHTTYHALYESIRSTMCEFS